MDEKTSSRRLSVPRWAWIIAIVIVILVLQLWINRSFSGPANTPLTNVARMIENGEVKKIEVYGNQVDVNLSDGTIEKSVKGEGSVIEQFRNLGVSEEALSSTDIEFNDPSTWNTILTIIISLGPVLLLIWIFSRSIKQFRRFFNISHNKESNLSNVERLRELNSLYVEELINKQEYETKKTEMLSDL
jgi:hypothetical protein